MNPSYEDPETLSKPKLESVMTMSKIRPERRCRDLPFLILFSLFWIGMITIASIGWSEGDPTILIFGLDYEGNLCNKGDLKGFKNRYWPDVNQLADIEDFGYSLRDATSICLKHCPSPNATVNGDQSTVAWVCKYPDPDFMSYDDWADVHNYDYYDKLSDEEKKQSRNFNGSCWPVTLESTSQYWSCQYTGEYDNATKQAWSELGGKDYGETSEVADKIEQMISDYLSEPVKVFERYISDLAKAWPVILVCGCVVSFLLSFVWLVLIRYFVACITWVSILLVNLLAIALTIFTYVKAGWIGDDAISGLVGEDNVDNLKDSSGQSLDASEDNKTTLSVIAIIMTIFTILLFVFTLIMIKRVNLAIRVLRAACQAIGAVPTVMLYPCLPFFQMFCLTIWWVLAAVWLFSSGDVERADCDLSDYKTDSITSCGYTVKFSKELQYMLVYHLFGLLWTLQFILAFTYCVIAGATANYYWTRGQVDAINASPVTSAMWRTFRYHMGSLALGSLISAIFQFIRIIVKYIEEKSKELKEKSDLAKCIFCYVNCCLACTQAIINFINRNAYIVVAIDGTSFCTSAAHAMKLLIANALRVAAVNIIGDSVLFLGKLAVAFGCALVSYIYLDDPEYTEGDNAISSPLLIVVIVLCISFAIASAFMAVTELTVDTMLMSYCIDCEENGGSPQFAPPLLMDAMDYAADSTNKTEETEMS